MSNFKSRKVVVVGAGAVGSGFAFALAQSAVAAAAAKLASLGCTQLPAAFCSEAYGIAFWMA